MAQTTNEDDSTGSEKSGNLYLRKFKTPKQWYTCNEETGAVTFQKAHVGRPVHPLSDAATLVLSLNQVYCEKGRGKVYLVHRPPYYGRHLRTDDPAHTQSFNKTLEPATMVYIPEPWPEARQVKFRKMKPYEQLQSAFAPYGLVQKEAVVLPFDCILNLNGEKEDLKPPGTTTAPVMVLTTPTAYVAPTQDFINKCYLHKWYTCVKGSEEASNCYYKSRKTGWDQFKRWKVPGIEGIAEILGQLFLDRDDLLATYGTLLHQVNTTFLQAVQLRRRWRVDPGDPNLAKYARYDAQGVQLEGGVKDGVSSHQSEEVEVDIDDSASTQYTDTKLDPDGDYIP